MEIAVYDVFNEPAESVEADGVIGPGHDVREGEVRGATGRAGGGWRCLRGWKERQAGEAE